MNIKQLSHQWHQSGIKEGDCVLLHSKVKRLYRNIRKTGDKNPLSTILNSFIDALGKDGTLIIPLFNFNFTSGSTFDIRNTPSQMGSLTEYARKITKSARSSHPVYSFCALGKYADQINSINNLSAYSDDSPFGFLRKVGGKIAILDLEDQESMTFYHHVEEICGVEYRYMKKFTSNYIDKNGNLTLQKNYSIYVRDINKGVLTNVNPAGEGMWEKEIYKGDRPFINSGLRTATAREVFDYTKEIIESGNAEGMLFKYSKTELH